MTIVQSTTYLTSKIGPVDAATRAKAVEIIKAANAAGRKIRFVWGYDPNAGNPEHHSGHALDIMTYSQSDNEWVRNYVWANRKRLRLKHVICNQTITSTVTSPGVRRKMDDRGNSTDNHFDHNHILFLDANKYVAPGTQAASAIPSLPKPAPAAPSAVKAPRFPLPNGWYFGPRSGPKESVSGHFGYRASLMAWQKQMRRRGWKINTDGYYNEKTERVVEQFQAEKKLGVDKRIGIKTWAAAWTSKVTR